MRLMLRYSFFRGDYEDHNFSISNNIIPEIDARNNTNVSSPPPYNSL